MTTHSTNPVKFLRCLVILNFRPMTIIAHPAQDPEKRTRGFKSLGIRVRSGRNVFNLSANIFLHSWQIRLLTVNTRDSRSCFGPARRARPPGPTFLQIFEGDDLYSTFTLGIIPQAVRLKARSLWANYGWYGVKKIMGKEFMGIIRSTDRDRPWW